MRSILQFSLLILTISLYGQSIIVNSTAAPESALDAEELTREVLIDGGECSDISNFELIDNPQAQFPNNNRSWGYFEKGTSDFPFERGIVLTSGFAREAIGPSAGTESDGDMYSWFGDPDADQLVGPATESYNTTIFEFDFVPFGNEISFNYIFASEEYPIFACNSSYNDVFGFIISGPGIVNDPGLSGKNIALLPNGDPVSIGNVNDQGCGDESFYVAGSFNSIAYNGRTIPLTAYSEVQPGETYHIRLLVSDAGDGSYDSAVFLEAGSFSLGGTLVDISGAEIGEDQTVCDVTSYPLIVDIDAPDATFQWYFNGDEIPGAINQAYTATETGYYEVLVTSGTCSTTVGVDIVFSTSPETENFEDFECTESGSFTFDLSAYNGNIGTPDLIYTYYNTFEGADEELLPDQILDFENFVVNEADGTVIVYVRVENEDGCYNVAELTLEVGIGPETEPDTYMICDEDGDGFAEFNMLDFAPDLVVGSPAGLAYEFYLDPAGTQLIPNPEAYTNVTPNTQIVYVKIYDPALGDEACPVLEELTLEVGEFPLLQPQEITICDNLNDNSEFIDLTDNEIVVTEGITVSYEYFTAGGIQITTPDNFEVTASPTVITVMVYNSDESCNRSETFTIYFNQAPLVQPAQLENCSSDGFALFHLPEANEQVVADVTNLDFSYYLTFEDAETGNPGNALPDDYTNEMPDNQAIYVRVLDENGCFNIAEVVLEVKQGPDMAPYTSAICDDNGDGIAEFNLELIAENLLTGAPENIQFGYFEDENATIPISNPDSFFNTSNAQIIYVTAIDISLGDEACVATEALTLVVEEFPEIQPWSIVQCDNLHDDTEIVDLTQNEIVVTEGITTTLHYFTAIGGTEIADPENFEVTTSSMTIYVYVRNTSGTCEDYRELTITLNESPDAVDNVITFEECSIDDYANYHLPNINEFLVADITNLNFTYYTSFQNAFDATAALPEDYQNTAPDQVIFVRVENADGCFDIAEVMLETVLVHNELEDVISVCDDPYEINDGIATFDLTQMLPDIENSLGGTGYNVTYFTSFEDALANSNVISDPTEFQNTESPQIIYTRATDGNGGCAGIVDFRVEVLPVPEFEMDDYVAFCNYDIDKIYEFFGPFETYTWYDANGNVIGNENTVQFQQEGIHTLEVTSSDTSCPARREIEVIFDNQPIISNIEVNEHTITILANGGLPPYEYSIDNGLTWTDDYIIHNVPGGIYDLIVRSKYGCISESKTFGVLGVPNLITPNGDGKNDFWEIRGLEAYPDLHIKIFDRYGKIFVDRPLTTDFRWEGKYLGNPVPSGDYWYIITVEEGKTLSGHISVRH